MHHKHAMKALEKAMHHMKKHHDHMEKQGKKPSKHHKKEHITKHDRAVDRKNIKKARKAKHHEM